MGLAGAEGQDGRLGNGAAQPVPDAHVDVRVGMMTCQSGTRCASFPASSKAPKPPRESLTGRSFVSVTPGTQRHPSLIKLP